MRGRERREKEGGREKEKKIRARSARRSKEGGGRQGAGGEVRGGRGRGIPSVHPLIPLGNTENLKMLFSDMYILKIPVGGGRGQDPKKLYSGHQTHYMMATRKVLWRPQNNYLAVAILLLWWPPDKSFGGR